MGTSQITVNGEPVSDPPKAKVAAGDFATCPLCQGAGYRTVSQLEPSPYVKVCEGCDGTGYMVLRDQKGVKNG